MSQHEYLGDGVYAEWTGEMIALRTGDHRNLVDMYLEPEMMEKLIAFYQKARNEEQSQTGVNHDSAD